MTDKKINYIIQYNFDAKNSVGEIHTIEGLLEKMELSVPNVKVLRGKLDNGQDTKDAIPAQYKLLTLSDFVLSANDRKNIIEPIIADWQEELFEALHNREIWKARWINFRYTYAFFVVMWKRVSIFNLIEVNSKKENKLQNSRENIKDLFIKKGLSIENQYAVSSIKLTKNEREKFAKIFSSSQQLSELINDDREER